MSLGNQCNFLEILRSLAPGNEYIFSEFLKSLVSGAGQKLGLNTSTQEKHDDLCLFDVCKVKLFIYEGKIDKTYVRSFGK